MTTDRDHALITQIATVVADLRDVGIGDGEAMLLVGSGASRLCGIGKVDTWKALKAQLAPAEIRAILEAMDKEDASYREADRVTHAYALQPLALSIAATGTKNPDVAAGAALLDDIIEATLVNYRKHAGPNAGTPN